MERLQLEVNLRAERGKSAMRKLRAAGKVPAILYGGGQKEPQPLDVDERALSAVLRQGTNQIIDLRGGEGFDTRLVLLKDYQREPVSRRLLHCDFYAVDTEQKIDVQVPVQIVGKARGVEQEGGILDVVQREVHMKCLPLSIPESLTIDVSELDIGDALHVSDLAVPEGVDLVTDPAQTLVHVAAPRVEETPEEDEEALVEGEVAEGEAPAGAEGEAPKAEESSGD